MVIWLTGLSGAGKTTIANALIEIMKPALPGLISVDGDAVRELFGENLGFDIKSRVEQIGRIQRLALFLLKQKLPVIVSALYSDPILFEWNRSNLPGYFEVYLKTPLAVVEKRDTKNFYVRARKGELRNVVGIDIPWQEPASPNIIFDTVGATAQEIAFRIIHAVPQLSLSYESFQNAEK